MIYLGVCIYLNDVRCRLRLLFALTITTIGIEPFNFIFSARCFKSGNWHLASSGRRRGANACLKTSPKPKTQPLSLNINTHSHPFDISLSFSLTQTSAQMHIILYPENIHHSGKYLYSCYPIYLVSIMQLYLIQITACYLVW